MILALRLDDIPAIPTSSTYFVWTHDGLDSKGLESKILP